MIEKLDELPPLIVPAPIPDPEQYHAFLGGPGGNKPMTLGDLIAIIVRAGTDRQERIKRAMEWVDAEQLEEARRDATWLRKELEATTESAEKLRMQVSDFERTLTEPGRLAAELRKLSPEDRLAAYRAAAVDLDTIVGPQLRLRSEHHARLDASLRAALDELAACNALLSEATEQLIWCSGSSDFAEGGVACKGWERGPAPLLRKLLARKRSEGERTIRDDASATPDPKPGAGSQTAPRIVYVAIRGNTEEDTCLRVDLNDGRAIETPLHWYPKLAQATRAQRYNFRVLGDGLGIHWPDLDEDLSLAGILAGRRGRTREERIAAILKVEVPPPCANCGRAVLAGECCGNYSPMDGNTEKGTTSQAESTSQAPATKQEQSQEHDMPPVRGDVDVDHLNSEVTRLILDAEQAEARIQAQRVPIRNVGFGVPAEVVRAWERVLDVENQLASIHPADTVEGAVARRGVVTAAIKAQCFGRAAVDAARFEEEVRPSSPRLADDLARLRAEAERMIL